MSSAAPTLSWQSDDLARALASNLPASVLVHGSAGIGAFEFAYDLARSLLCESPTPLAMACGSCTSCHLISTHTHADLKVLVPQAIAVAWDWPVAVDERKKPSRQIRMEEVQEALTWVTTTSARGRAKVLVIHPASAMNGVAASALLKTLEEPAAGVRIVLTASDPGRLLPTIVSRCVRLSLAPPTQAQALEWLKARGVDDAQVLLAGCGGAPLEVLELHALGVTSAQWNSLPRAVIQADAQAFSQWPVGRVAQTLYKICHDAMTHRALATHPVIGSRLFFPGTEAFAQNSRWEALEAWRKSLLQILAHSDHPWNEPVLLDSLLLEGQAALRAAPTRRTHVG